MRTSMNFIRSESYKAYTKCISCKIRMGYDTKNAPKRCSKCALKIRLETQKTNKKAKYHAI